MSGRFVIPAPWHRLPPAPIPEMGAEEGPKRGSQARRPCGPCPSRPAAGLRLVAAPSSPRRSGAPPPLPRRTVRC